MKEAKGVLLRAVVIGADHHNTLGIVRCLGEAEIRVSAILFSTGRSFVQASRYLEEAWMVPEEEDSVMDILQKQFVGDGQKPLLIPSCDFAAWIIDKNDAILKERYLLPSVGLSGGSIAGFQNKHEMNQFVQSFGIPVPAFDKLEMPWDADGSDLEKNWQEKGMTFPLILKPLASRTGTKEFIQVVRSSEELKHALEKLAGRDLLVQQYLDKEREFSLAGYAAGPGSQVVIPGVLEKLRQATPGIGPASYGRILKQDPAVNTRSYEEMVGALGYDGIFDIDLMQSGDTLWFIEMNLRNGAYGYAFHRCGCNLPMKWCLLRAGEPEGGWCPLQKEIHLMNEIADFQNVRRGDLSLMRWCRQLVGAEAKMVWNVRDPGPFLAKLMKGGRRP